MADTLTVRSTDFVRDFPRYQAEAIRRQVVVVTNHNRVVGGFLSPEELEHYERMKAREREVLRIGELPEDLVQEIEAAQYGVAPE